MARTRQANPFGEGHGRALTVIELITAPTVDPSTVTAKIEGALAAAGLKLFDRGDHQQNAFVCVSRAPNGGQHYVALHLYVVGCSNPACPTGHAPAGLPLVTLNAAPAVTPANVATLAAAVGEDPANVLTGGPGDAGILQALGFGALSPAMRADHLLTAEDHRLFERAVHLEGVAAAAEAGTLELHEAHLAELADHLPPERLAALLATIEQRRLVRGRTRSPNRTPGAS